MGRVFEILSELRFVDVAKDPYPLPEKLNFELEISLMSRLNHLKFYTATRSLEVTKNLQIDDQTLRE